MRAIQIDKGGVRWQQSSASSLAPASPPPALAFQKAGSVNGITGIPDQCRRRRSWKQEEGKDATSRSAHDNLAQKNRVPVVSEWLKMTLVLFQARKKVTVMFSDHLNFTVGGSVDGRKMHFFKRTK